MIQNISNGAVLCDQTIVLSEKREKSKGLMFTRKKDAGFIFVFGKSQVLALHTFFMFYPIDVIWIDNRGRIVDSRENLKPFKLVIPDKESCHFIELPSGTLRRTMTKIGDYINIDLYI